MATHNVFTLSNEGSTKVSPDNATAGRDFTVQNIGSGYVYLGANENVSNSSFGFKLSPGAAWSVELNGKDEVWATTDNSENDVAVFAFGLEVSM